MKYMDKLTTRFSLGMQIRRWHWLILLTSLPAMAGPAALGRVTGPDPLFTKPLHSSRLVDMQDEDSDGMRCEEHTAGPKQPGKPFLVVPGIYQNFDNTIGAEISMIRGIFGLALGLQDDSAGYLEGELVIGPLSLGFGPRLKNGKLTPQTTIALPFFYIFPYWRWTNDETAKNNRRQEFGIMLKFPLEFGGSSQSKGHFLGPSEEGTAI